MPKDNRSNILEYLGFLTWDGVRRLRAADDFAFINQRLGELAADDELQTCLRCGSTVGVNLESSRTQYNFEGELGSPEDPNRPVPLCRTCAEDHHAYWDEMWAEYYGGLL